MAAAQKNKKPETLFFVGARTEGAGAFFRVWAPACQKVAVVIEDNPVRVSALTAEGDGYFSGHMKDVAPGDLYKYALDDDPKHYPDPASRYQPQGPHGPSQLVDAGSFEWSDAAWRGIADAEHIIYEMHIGTFTPEGTWRAAAAELPELAALGVTTIEMLPIADFPGRFGWGYDGVNLYAPTRLYGTPDDLKFFVDTAHRLGLALLLDVVYNHMGPDGNYLAPFSKHYFSERYKNEWGDALNFDDEFAGPVRDYFLGNVAYWISEFHFDGLRLDATQNIYDASSKHLIAEIVETAERAAAGRTIFIIAENEPQNSTLIRPPTQKGFGASAIANDDFHHSALVAMTGRNEAYYTDYLGTPQEFVSLAKRGFLFQGQRYDWQKNPRGSSTRGIPLHRFVNFLENHDQVANSGRGYRAYTQTSPGRHRAITAILLLFPETPMLFQGQEFGSSHPFYYFADHGQELAQMVNAGRKAFLGQFPSLATAEMKVLMPDPANPETFVHSKLDLTERVANQHIYALHRDLIALRRHDRTFAQPSGGLDGAVLGPEAFVIRYFGDADEDRLLITNLGRDLHYSPAPEPLLAPPAGKDWAVLWSSEDPKYHGQGTAPPSGPENWRIPGHATIVLHCVPSAPETEEMKHG